MFDPFTVLELPSTSDDETIRRRYLELVRQFTPEHHPERFAAIRAAYEALRDLPTRVRRQLFEVDREESVDAILEEVTCRLPRRRVTLQELLAARGKR